MSDTPQCDCGRPYEGLKWCASRGGACRPAVSDTERDAIQAAREAFNDFGDQATEGNAYRFMLSYAQPLLEAADALVSRLEAAERERDETREQERHWNIEACYAEAYWKEGQDALESAEAALEEARRALSWYAERRNYREAAGDRDCTSVGDGLCALMNRDSYDGQGPGARARNALATVAGGTDGGET